MKYLKIFDLRLWYCIGPLSSTEFADSITDYQYCMYGVMEMVMNGDEW
jgi:hypothetical protein